MFLSELQAFVDDLHLMLSDMRAMGPGDSVSWLLTSSCAAYTVSLGGDLPSDQGLSYSGCQLWAFIQKATAGPSAKGTAPPRCSCLAELGDLCEQNV